MNTCIWSNDSKDNDRAIMNDSNYVRYVIAALRVLRVSCSRSLTEQITNHLTPTVAIWVQL